MTKINLSVENLSKFYHIEGKDVCALDNINFTVSEGECFGIIGRNGAGKSTLLKLLSGFIKPSQGTIKYNGDIAAILDLGWSFHPHLSGFENINIAARLQGVSKAEAAKKLEEIMDFSELDADVLKRQVFTYSSGMFLRLAFSTIMAWPKKILVFDEVLTVGDSFFIIKSAQKMMQLKNEGHTIVLVSHHMDQINNYCDNVMLLDEGKQVFTGRKELVIKKYQDQLNPYQEILQGAPPDCELIGFSVDGHHLEAKFNDHTVFSANQEIKITFKVKITSLIERTDVAFLITDFQGRQLFSDDSFDWPSERVNGILDICWTIPARIMNEGIFNLHLFWFVNRKLYSNTVAGSVVIASSRVKRFPSEDAQPFFLKDAMQVVNQSSATITL